IVGEFLPGQVERLGAVRVVADQPPTIGVVKVLAGAGRFGDGLDAALGVPGQQLQDPADLPLHRVAGVVIAEPFSSCVAAGLDGLEREDGLHDWGAALRAAAQLGQNAPGLEGGYGAFTDAADAGVAGVDLALTYRQRRAVAAAFERGADAAAGA